MSEPPDVGGVPVAPNRCEIKAKVLSKQQHASFPDKWLYEIEILESTDKQGPNFARSGQVAQAFSFEASEQISTECLIVAEAEYTGGPTRGQFQLTHVKVE